MKRTSVASFFLAVALCAAMLLSGCIGNSPHPTTQPSTAIDPAQADPQFWFNQGAVATVSDNDFFKLWEACKTEARFRFFIVDRENYREGLLTTEPLVSKQFFEVWRRDAVTLSDVSDASLATIRRTIHFQLHKAYGRYVMEPRVVVERYSSAERRLTAINEYHAAFSGPRPTGDIVADQTGSLPSEYWYAVGRDHALERDLADSIRQRVAE